MNGRKAKRLRRQVYGDQSLRQPREYVLINHSGWWGRAIQIINKPGSLRALYQAAKKRA